MRNILAVCSKELYTYFVSPIAYFVCFVFTAISGFLFSILLITTSGQQAGTGTQVMGTIFGNMAIILLFFIPVLTMKLFAEERKSGTIELPPYLTRYRWTGRLGQISRELDSATHNARLDALFPTFGATFWSLG